MKRFCGEKFGDISSALEEFEENWEEYPFETCCKDNYLGRFASNYLFGLTFIGTDFFDCFSLEDISIDEKRKEEIKKSLEQLFEHEVICNYYIFTHWY